MLAGMVERLVDSYTVSTGSQDNSETDGFEWSYSSAIEVMKPAWSQGE